MRVELIVFSKAQRYLVIDGKAVVHPYGTLKNTDLMRLTINTLTTAGFVVRGQLPLHVQNWSRRWPKSKFTYWNWVITQNQSKLAEEISQWTHDVGVDYAMAQIYRRYETWARQQELAYMEHLL